MSQLEFTRRIDAPKAVVWDVITDHDLYAQAAPNLTSVEVIDGAKGRMVRQCVDTDGNAWTEACTSWDDGRRFAVEVDVSNSDYHRHLFTRFEGEWGLIEASNGLAIAIRFDYDTKYGPIGRLISSYLAYKAPGIVEAIFDRWESEINSRTASRKSGEGRDQTASATVPPHAVHR